MIPEFESIVSRVLRVIADASSQTSLWTVAGDSMQGAFETEFDEIAQQLFQLQFKHNAVYQRFCLARGVSPDNLPDWRRIPPMPTAAFKEFNVTCLPPEQRTVVFLSSGTTGRKQSRHFHSADSIALYEAALLPWFARHVLPEVYRVYVQALQTGERNRQMQRWRLLILSPPPSEAPHSSLVHMFETVRRVFGAPDSRYYGCVRSDGLWQLNLKELCSALADAAVAGRPVVLLGTAFSFVHLLDHMGAGGLVFNLPPGSRVMETGGYKGQARALSKTELYELITARLGIMPGHIVCEYGMCELSSQAYDTVSGAVGPVAPGAAPGPAVRSPAPTQRVFGFPPWARAQVVSPETGEEVCDGAVGLIRVFDLANVFSVLAVQTEDLGVRRGAGFELLGRAPAAELRGCSLLQVPD